MSCLGAILLDNDIYHRTEGLSVWDLALDSHRRIYAAMVTLASEGQPIDLVTVSQFLADRKELETVGGVTYLSTLTEGLPRRDNIDHYVRIVQHKAKLRQIIHSCNAAIGQAMNQQDEPNVVIGELERKMLELAAADRQGHGQHISKILPEVRQRLEELRSVPKGVHALWLTTGIPELDVMTTGLHPSEMTVAAAYTGDGKTSYALQVIIANLLKGFPCKMFSLEMKRHDIVTRLIAMLSKILPLHLRDPRLMDLLDAGEYDVAEKQLAKLPFYLDDTAGLTIDELVRRGRLHARRDGCKLFVVDYLKLVKVPSLTKNVERLSNVSSELLEFAKTEKVHVLSLSQFSVPEGKKKRVPTIFDIKESGDIANDAHNVLLLYRPETEDGTYTGFDKIFIGKQRAGPTGKINVAFNKERLRWEYREVKQEHRDE